MQKRCEIQKDLQNIKVLVWRYEYPLTTPITCICGIIISYHNAHSNTDVIAR